jgi:four helix bundle protein
MVPFRFKQFKVYQDAKAFRQHVLKLVVKLVERHAFDLADQIRRASLSVILNIAEGSAKKSDVEFARFLETSTGSVNEVVAGFDVAHDDGIISNNDLVSIQREAGKILMQLGGFIKSLRTNQRRWRS